MSPVAVGPDTVVSMKIELALEAELEGRHPGESIKVHLEPEQAFGEYDANQLSRTEAFYRCDP